MAELIEPIEKYALSKDSRPKSLFSKVGLIGCGEVGRSIARMVSSKGIDVVFVELSNDKIKYAIEELGKDLDILIDNWGLTTSEKRSVISRIQGSTDYKILKGCDLVIEAVILDCCEYEERKKIFKKIEEQVDNDAIIVSNSTTTIISELVSSLKNPARCMSLHFISPAPDANVLEVVRGLYTSDATYEKVKKFAALLGKKVIPVINSPGVISARLVVPLINEACQVLMEDVSTMEDIDITMQLGYGLPLGPFAMADKIGLDKLLHWCENLFFEFGDKKYKASPIIKKYVLAGRLGRKVHKGFYEYDNYGRKITKEKI